jgi:hypothetical protein
MSGKKIATAVVKAKTCIVTQFAYRIAGDDPKERPEEYIKWLMEQIPYLDFALLDGLSNSNHSEVMELIWKPFFGDLELKVFVYARTALNPVGLHLSTSLPPNNNEWYVDFATRTVPSLGGQPEDFRISMSFGANIPTTPEQRKRKRKSGSIVAVIKQIKTE